MSGKLQIYNICKKFLADHPELTPEQKEEVQGSYELAIEEMSETSISHAIELLDSELKEILENEE